MWRADVCCVRGGGGEFRLYHTTADGSRVRYSLPVAQNIKEGARVNIDQRVTVLFRFVAQKSSADSNAAAAAAAAAKVE